MCCALTHQTHFLPQDNYARDLLFSTVCIARSRSLPVMSTGIQDRSGRHTAQQWEGMPFVNAVASSSRSRHTATKCPATMLPLAPVPVIFFY